MIFPFQRLIKVDKKELNMVWTAMGITSLGIITFSIRHRFG